MCIVLFLTGCSDGVHLIREGDRTGVMTYVYKGGDGHMVTPKRSEAFEKIREFCGGPFNVVQEGKTKGRQRVVEGVAGSDVIVEDWWGIRFQCQN